nr:unnamed protein product [Digitaria exilis]
MSSVLILTLYIKLPKRGGYCGAIPPYWTDAGGWVGWSLLIEPTACMHGGLHLVLSAASAVHGGGDGDLLSGQLAAG